MGASQTRPIKTRCHFIAVSSAVCITNMMTYCVHCDRWQKRKASQNNYTKELARCLILVYVVVNFTYNISPVFHFCLGFSNFCLNVHSKITYCRGTARRAMSVEIIIVNCCRAVRKISFDKACNTWVTLKIIQGHHNCRYSIGYISFLLSNINVSILRRFRNTITFIVWLPVTLRCPLDSERQLKLKPRAFSDWCVVISQSIHDVYSEV